MMTQKDFFVIGNFRTIMKIRNPILNVLLFLVLTAQQACGQQNKTTTYKGHKFTLEYPAQWQTTNENGILNFFPVENYGAVTLSYHSGIDFPLEETKEFILDMNQIEDKRENVKVAKKGDVTEFSYEHIDNNLKWVTKAFRKNTDFYLLTINCELTKWDSNKDTFLTVINSFRLH